jgi:hypothetical protein
MLKRTFVLFALVAFLNSVIGCHYAAKVPVERLKGGSEKITKVALLDGRTIQFDEDGAMYLSSARKIFGFSTKVDSIQFQGRGATVRSVEAVNVPIDSVLQVWVQKTDPVATTLAVIGVAALVAVVVALVVAALKESCPFVYSWDGQKYVFDAEPLGGAICEGLQRSECSRLEYLKPDHDQYRLRFRNEVPETQYLDQVELLVVDHTPEQIIVPDTAGHLHVVTSAQPPVKATDENGKSIGKFVSQRDGLAWQTQMTEAVLKSSSDTRHHLTFEFPKPAGTRHARLIVNAGTAIWGSNMIREMLQMRGSHVDEWYQAVNQKGMKALQLLSFNLREEMYLMKVQVLKNDTFVERALILGGGPFVTEDRVIDLDVSDLSGDKLTLKLDPPKGFWTIDYLALEYDDTAQATPQVIPIAFGTDQDGRDIAPQLAMIDSDRYVMAHMGDWADIGFNAPPTVPNRSRSIFLKTTGYYEVQIDKTAPEQTALINRLMSEPGTIASYSIERYLEWKQQQERRN